jgi:hypothetical protein
MKLAVTIATASLFLQYHETHAFINHQIRSSSFLDRKSRSKTTLDGSRDISNLQEWATENKIEVSPLASLSQGSGENYGITLKKSSEKYEMILSVPKDLVLDSEYIRREWFEHLEPALDLIQNNGLHESALNFVLMVKVLFEHNLGNESRWNVWIDSLPRSFDTGVCMDEVEIGCLPPFALALANFEIQQLEIFQEAYELLKGTPIYVDPVNQERSQWAFNVVMTRCWRYAQEDDDSDMIRPIAVPFGDMFNHKEPANVAVKDSDSFDSVDFVLAQDIEVPEGEEVGLFLSYGLTNPHRFLTVFGFCDETMPEVFSQLLFNNPTPELINLGCNDRSKMVYRTVDGGIAIAVWDCILYTLLAQVPQEQELFYSAHLKGNTEEKLLFHKKYGLEEALTVKNHVEATANEFKDLVTKIDAMSEEEQASHPRLPMIRRHNRFLFETFDKVKDRVKNRIYLEGKRRKELK